MQEITADLNGMSTSLKDILAQAASDGAEYVHLTTPRVWGGSHATILADIPAMQEHFKEHRGAWHDSSVWDLTGEEPEQRGASEMRYGVLESN